MADSFAQKRVYQECCSYDNQQILLKAIENTTPRETNDISDITQNKHDFYELKKAYKDNKFLQPYQQDKNIFQNKLVYTTTKPDFVTLKKCFVYWFLMIHMLHHRVEIPSFQKHKNDYVSKYYRSILWKYIERFITTCDIAKKQNKITVDPTNCYNHLTF